MSVRQIWNKSIANATGLDAAIDVARPPRFCRQPRCQFMDNGPHSGIRQPRTSKTERKETRVYLRQVQVPSKSLSPFDYWYIAPPCPSISKNQNVLFLPQETSPARNVFCFLAVLFRSAIKLYAHIDHVNCFCLSFLHITLPRCPPRCQPSAEIMPDFV